MQAGIGATAVLTFMLGLCPLAVFIAGLKKGDFHPTRFDLLCGASSLIALILWQLTGNGALAVVLSIIADGLAATPTLIKAYNEPESESPFLFMLFALSAGVTLLAAKSWTLESIGFSAYILALYVTLYVLVRFELGNSAPRLLQEQAEAPE